MDDERLKNPNYIFGEDYFERTLERIRNIRSSERRFYQKITDIKIDRRKSSNERILDFIMRQRIPIYLR